MTDETKNAEAAVLAKRATTQAKNAAKNTGRAARVAAEPVIDSVAEEIHETAEKLEDTVDDVRETAKRFNMQALSATSTEMAIGFFATSVAIGAGVIASRAFRQAYNNRSFLLKAE